MIIDVSEHQGKIDWGQARDGLDFAVLRASIGTRADKCYGFNARECERLGVPFHAYHYLKAADEAEARTEARVFAEAVAETAALFYVIDAEYSGIDAGSARGICEAFEGALRHYAGDNIRVAVYIGHHLYRSWALDYARYAYVWVPRYGGKKPDWPCDLWQYTDQGTWPGISGRVDLDRLNSEKGLAFFTTREDDKTMLTGKQLAEYCEQVFAHKWVYWYGTYGKRCTESLYKSKKAQYPAHYTAAREAGYKKDIANGGRCADCVGMIKSFFWTGGQFDTEPKYGSNHCPDTSANGMINLCAQTGPISTMPDEPGLVVWKSGHIGVYVGNGMTVEMKGFDYDCKRNKVSAGPWVKWGRLPASMIDYTGEACDDCEVAAEPGERWLRNGDEGEDVKQLQRNLIALGYSCGKWGCDGEFGDCTEMALVSFQRDHGLTADGVYGAETIEAMEQAMEQENEPAEEPRYVVISGGNCYVRSAPNTDGKKLGVAYRGDNYTWQGETSADGWQLIEFRGQNGWVSGKYGKLVSEG